MMALRSFVVAASFFLGIGLVTPAYAEPTQDAKDTARAYVKEGRELFSAKQYERAAGLFEKAHTIMHAPTTALHLMETYAFLGKDAEAWAIGEEIQHQAAPPGESDAYKDARVKINDAMEGLATRVSTFVLRFKGSRPPGVVVTIDEKPLGLDLLDKPVRVNRGEHLIWCTAPNFAQKKITQSVLNKTAEEFVIVIDMEPLPPPPPDPPPDTQGSEASGASSARAPDTPSRVPWVVFGASGALALGLGVWAGVTYAPMAEVWNEPVYSRSRETQFDGSAAKLQGLSISSAAMGVVSVGALGFALVETFRPRKIPTHAQVAVSSHGLSVVGVW